MIVMIDKREDLRTITEKIRIILITPHNQIELGNSIREQQI